MRKGIRPGKVNEINNLDFVKSLSEVEKKQIMQQREFEKIKPGTPAYKIALENDNIYRALLADKINIRKEMIEIQNLLDSIVRHKAELLSGMIKTEIKTGMLMNSDELKTLIRKEEFTLNNTVLDLTPKLWHLRSFVGIELLNHKIGMTEEEYNAFIQEIESELKENGLRLYSLEA